MTRLVSALLVALVLAGTALGAEPRYLASLEELPLMPGLTELADRGVDFDSPEGRIVEAYAQGPVARDDVLRFYAETLPQLGWAPVQPGLFRRDNEELRVDPVSAEDPTRLTVRFALSPIAAVR